MEETIEIPLIDWKTLKDASDLLGCTDKTLRNYIKAGKLNFQEVDSPYGQQYLVDFEQAKILYEKKDSRVDSKIKYLSTPPDPPENSSLKELLPTIENFRADYKEAMEKMTQMSFHLGNSQAETKQLTDTTLQKAALEKQVAGLLVTKGTLEAQLKAETERVEELKAQIADLKGSLEKAKEAIPKTTEEHLTTKLANATLTEQLATAQEEIKQLKARKWWELRGSNNIPNIR